MSSFYKLNTKVLSFDICDIDKIRFNHYIMQRENLQRLRGDLPRGQFYLTARKVSKDLDISICKVQGILKTFVNLGIIEAVKVGGKDRTPSIYSYVSSQNANTVGSTHKNTVNNTVNSRFSNSLGRNNNTVSNTVGNTVNSTYKKDLFKNNNKIVKPWTPQFDFD
jgi:hypothetical protein